MLVVQYIGMNQRQQQQQLTLSSTTDLRLFTCVYGCLSDYLTSNVQNCQERETDDRAWPGISGACWRATTQGSSCCV